MQKSVKVAALIIIILFAGILIIFFGRNPYKEQQNLPPSEPGPSEPGPGPEPGQEPEEFNLPEFDKNAPLPGWTAKVPKPELIKKELGNVEITAYSSGIIRGMFESGLDYFITLKNTGITEATVNFLGDDELIKQVPSWNLHFYSFQDSPITLAGGEEKKLWYFLSLDEGGKEPFEVTFKIWLQGSSNTFELPVLFGSVSEDFRGKETSAIYGYVRDDEGNPVSNARIDALMNCGRSGFRGDTDEKGRYIISVLAMEDIDAIYEGRDLACDSTDYYISAIKDGYEYYFQNNIAPARENPVRLDMTLEKIKEQDSFGLNWEKHVDEPYGFFWVKPTDDWNYFAASEAKHPPQLDQPTHFYMLDSTGSIVWEYATGNECWGIDIAGDGSKVVAGCHDNYIYSIDKNGRLLWKFDAQNMVRSICLSNDGAYAVSGAIQKLYLFTAESGAKDSISWIDEWFRNCDFYYDDSGFVVGARTLSAFKTNGYRIWSNIIGEFPMFLATDTSKSTFAAGKSRTLFSFDAVGNLRFKHRIPDHVVTAGAITPDGSRIALGTVGGMVYLFDNSGKLLWKRSMTIPGEPDTTGHNAIAISQDGKRIVAGTAPNNCIIVYNEKGTIVWKGCEEPEVQSSDMMEGVTSVQISPDNAKIIAAYGDNYIRQFKKQ